MTVTLNNPAMLQALQFTSSCTMYLHTTAKLSCAHKGPQSFHKTLGT